MQIVKHYGAYICARVALAFVQSLSQESCHYLARRLAVLMHSILRIRRSVVEENLRHAFPGLNRDQRDRIALRMWEHLFLLASEVAHTERKIHYNNWRKHVRLCDADVIMRALYDDRPVILVTGHYGNFEISNFVLGMYGFETYTVARPLDNPFLDRFLGQFRRSRGQHLVNKQGSATLLEEVLRGGGTVAVLADQHAGPKGCHVEFFGRPASTHKAIALFALQHDAPLITAYARRTGGSLQFDIGCTGKLDPRDVTHADPVRFITQWFTNELEKIIRIGPEQYWWVHRRWKESQPRRRSHKAAA